MDLQKKTCALSALTLALLSCSQTRTDNTDLSWSTFIGGSCTDEGFGIAVDGSGSAYVTGFTNSVEFPTTAGAFDTTFNGGSMDAFAIKLTPMRSALAYVTFLGGNGYDEGFGIVVDGSGSAYVTGRTNSVDFPATTGAFDTTQNGDYDLFVVKLTPTGGTLAYATFLGGRDYDNGESIALDHSGNAYLTGWTRSDNFPSTFGAFRTIYNGNKRSDAFVVKLSPAGSDLGYSTFLGGVDEDRGNGIAVNDSGSAYVGVLTYSGDFPTTAGAFDTTYNGIMDAAVVKLDPSGSGLIYATFLGGGGQDWGQDIAVDGSGSAYLTGATHSGDFPITVGAFDTSHNGSSDVFVAKLNPAGSALLYSTFLGGSDEECGTGIVLDHSGNSYLTGWTRSVNFPTTAAAFDTSYNGKADAFLAEFNPLGDALGYATFLGGSSDDVSHGIGVDGSGNAYLTGWTESVDFPTTAGAFDASHNGKEDIFVSALSLNGHLHPRDGGRLRDGQR